LNLPDVMRAIREALTDYQEVRPVLTLPNGGAIIATAAGTLVPHGVTRRTPRAAWAQTIGNAAGGATTVGEVTRTHVRVYAASPTTCQLWVAI